MSRSRWDCLGFQSDEELAGRPALCAGQGHREYYRDSDILFPSHLVSNARDVTATAAPLISTVDDGCYLVVAGDRAWPIADSLHHISKNIQRAVGMMLVVVSGDHTT